MERVVDRLQVLYEVADGYSVRYPEGNEPFRILSRMTEELGEVAAEISHLERTGAKVLKRGEPDRKALGYEIEDLLHTALTLARWYGVEDAVDEAAQKAHAGLSAGGEITATASQFPMTRH